MNDRAGYDKLLVETSVANLPVILKLIRREKLHLGENTVSFIDEVSYLPGIRGRPFNQLEWSTTLACKESIVIII